MPLRRTLTPLLLVSALVVAGLIARARPVESSASWIEDHRVGAERLMDAALADDFAWQRLAELTDTFGPRLSGTPNLDQAIAWTVKELEKDGFDAVRTEPVMVPRWVRGRESLAIVEPGPRSLPTIGLGGTVATPGGGVTADALVVESFEALERRATEARGRIVVFDVPFTTYGETVRYRVAGASRAARHGAVAVLVRSVGPMGLRTTHTGALTYAESVPKIPAAAIAAEDAAMLARMQRRGATVRLHLTLEGRDHADVPSANVVAELRGRERPDEIVVVGGHFDSWDVGTGASDDAVGCVIAWEALRLMKRTNLRPRRTVRLVLFTNEENGLRGGSGYLERHRSELPNHVLMFESDMGVFPPLTMGFTGPATARRQLETLVPVLGRLGIDRLAGSGGGADIGPSVEAGRIPSMSLGSDPTRYFTVHHTPADTVDRIDPRDVSRAAAAIAVLSWFVAEMPGRLGDVAESTR
jgi:carboxypeptidase Q